jgi:hypothetical protein
MKINFFSEYKMKRIYPLLFAIFLSSCATAGAPAPTSTFTASPTKTPAVTETSLAAVTPVCISPASEQEDIDRALSYTDDVFDPAEWEQTYVVGEENVSVTWQNIPQSAVVFLEAVIFPCGYEEPDLNRFLNDDHWEALFANYDSHELIDECSSEGGLRLYEFEAASQGFDYNISYWSENDTNERIITTMITFPFGSEAIMDEYSIELFPELPNCS